MRAQWRVGFSPRGASAPLLILCVLLSAPVAFAQLDNDTITVTASRQASLPADQALVGVTVSAPPEVPLEDVLALIGPAGFNMANLTGTYSLVATQWSFSRAVSFDRVSSTLAALAAARDAGAQKDPRIDIAYYLQGAQVSDQVRAAHPCVFPSLLSDAQRQAQNIAAAAGVRVGSIVAMSDSGGVQGVIGYVLPAVRLGDFSQWFSPSLGSFLLGSAPPTCVITVQFRLVR